MVFRAAEVYPGIVARRRAIENTFASFHAAKPQIAASSGSTWASLAMS